MLTRRALIALALPAALAACGGSPEPVTRSPQGPAEINRLISKYARIYDIPESLIHETVQRESGYNPAPITG